MTTWDNDSIFLFLELYQSEPAIWDPKNKYHKDKPKVNDAWLRISSRTEIDVVELKKKKESLMACFRSHLRRKKASIKSGAGEEDLYKPIWPFYSVMEAFLGEVYECAPTISTEDNVPTSQIVEDEGSRSDSASTSISVRFTPTPQTSASTTETLRELSSSKQGKRSRMSNPELQEAGKQMKEAFSTLSNVLSKRSENKEDECDLYGKLLAKRLRKLPEDEREEAMYEIDGILLQKGRRRNAHNFWYADSPSRSFISSNQATVSSPMSSPYSAPPLPVQVQDPQPFTFSTYPQLVRDIRESDTSYSYYTKQACSKK